MSEAMESASDAAKLAVHAAVVRGKILAYRVFDAGDTISLDRAQTLARGAKQLVVGGPLVEGLVISSRPVEIDLGEREVVPGPNEKPLRAHVTAHLFDFGVVTFLYELEIADGTELAALTPLCDALYDSVELDHHAEKLLAEVEKMVGDAIERPHPPIEPESYTVILAEKITGAKVSEVARAEVAAKLLLGETSVKSLSPSVREDILKNAFSYLEDDLVIIDWNSALVIEPNGSLVVPHLLELATSQLLEFRFYDSILDLELGRVYDQVEKTRQRILRSPYRRLTHQVLQRFMELTELTERVDNAIKSVGDVYLARVYSAALRRFRVPEWRDSVESKLTLVGRSYDLLKGDVESARSQLLELVVIVLIIAELLVALHDLRH